VPTEANKAVVRRLWEEAWNQGNLAVADDIFDADYAAHEKAFVPVFRAAFPDSHHTIEDMIILDALYMTVTTLSTVGFGEVHPLSHWGRAFTIGLILFGVSTMAWAAESMVKALLEDHVHHAWWRRRMERVIDRLSDHYIVCGYGRMGAQIGRELTRLQHHCVGRGH
jgi:hypothetical protein